MVAVLNTPEPETLAGAIELIHRRDSELRRASQRLVEARQELEDTNRGLIALHSELQAAQQAEARLAAVVQSSNDAIISMTTDGVIETWNPGANRLLGHEKERIVGQPAQCLMPVQSQKMFAKSLQQIRCGLRAEPYDTQWSRADLTLVDVTVNVFALRDTGGDLIGLSAIARDITRQVEAQGQLEWLAHFDSLTSLVNRPETMARLESALTCARNPGPQLGILFCDVDNFKAVNDTWGHAVGDLVLTTLARRIHGCVRQDDTVGRIGGDEALVILPGVHSLDEVAQIAEKIRCRAAEPIDYSGHAVQATLSIGATIADPGETVLTMMARVDAAMYAAKHAGRDTVICI